MIFYEFLIDTRTFREMTKTDKPKYVRGIKNSYHISMAFEVNYLIEQ
jgi:hypothetical protein